AWRLFGPQGETFIPSAAAGRVLVGGDVSFDLEIRTVPYVGAYRLDTAVERQSATGRFVYKAWKFFCRMVLPPRYFSTFIYQSFHELLAKNPENEKKKDTSEDSKKLDPFSIQFSSEAARFSYPFEKIKPLFQERDIVFVNLETPLTDNPRVQGWFASDPGYAQ